MVFLPWMSVASCRQLRKFSAGQDDLLRHSGFLEQLEKLIWEHLSVLGEGSPGIVIRPRFVYGWLGIVLPLVRSTCGRIVGGRCVVGPDLHSIQG